TLPKNLLPQLFKYRYEWSDKAVTKKDNKNAYVKKLVEEVKVVEPKIVEKKPKKEEKKEKKEDVKKSPSNGVSSEQTNGHQQKSLNDAKALRSVAEKARTQDELAYL